MDRTTLGITSTASPAPLGWGIFFVFDLDCPPLRCGPSRPKPFGENKKNTRLQLRVNSGCDDFRICIRQVFAS